MLVVAHLQTARACAFSVADRRVARPRGGKLSEGRYLEWAQLMARVFEIDVTRRPRCGTRGMQVIACVTQPDIIRKILAHIGARRRRQRPR